MAVVNAEAQGSSTGQGQALVTTPAVGSGSVGTSAATGYGQAKAGVPPLTPSLLAPNANAVVDLSTAQFQWTYTSPQGLAQGAYALRFMAQQATTWSWYKQGGNLLTAVDASFETGIGSWTGTNATLAQSNAEALDGSYSLALTASTAANMSAQTGANLYGVAPGLVYTGMAWVRAAATARTCTVGIAWYTSAGALISTSTSPGVADATGSWTLEVTAPATAPATAAFAQLVVTVESPAASEVHYVDEAGLFATTSPNLVYDSNLSLAIAATNPTWNANGPLTIGTADGDWNVLNAGTDQAEWVYYGTGSNPPANYQFTSEPIPVTPGQAYELSALVSIPAGVSNAATTGLYILDAANPNTTIVYFNNGVAGETTVISGTYTPAAGQTSIRVAPYVYSTGTYPAGSVTSFSQIQLTETSSVQPYQPGPVWSAGGLNALVPYEVFNPSSAQTSTPGIPPLQNGLIWSWEVAVEDTNGLPSPYSLPFLVTGSPTPVVTPTQPTGTLTTGSQTLVWINSNIVQMASWQVIVYTQAQTTATGFSPGSSPWVWNTGVVNGSASSVQLPNLPTGIFYAYIQITSSLGQSSAWTSWELDYSYAQPPQPTLSGTYNASNQTVTLNLGDSSGFPASSFGSVYRSNDGGNTWTVVSTFDLVALTASGTVQTETDFTPNPSQDPGSFSNVDYYGVIVGPGGIVSPRSTTLSLTPTFPASVPGWSFLDATDYQTTWQPMITEFQQTQPIRGGLHTVLGLETQVQTYDVLGGRTLKLKAITLAETDWVNLRAMLQSMHILYLTNVYGLVGFFTVDPTGYSTVQQPGSIAATIRETTFTLIEIATLPGEGAGT